VEFNLTNKADEESSFSVPGSRHDSENQLLQSAEIDIPQSSDWLLKVWVKQGGSLTDEFSTLLHVGPYEVDRSASLAILLFAIFGLFLLGVYLWRHRMRAPLRKGLHKKRVVEDPYRHADRS
jgi:hypothetical protein